MRQYTINKITKKQCEDILTQFHYLSRQGFKFRVGFNYGLFLDNLLVGVAIYTCHQYPKQLKVVLD